MPCLRGTNMKGKEKQIDRCANALERIADYLEEKEEIDTRGIELAEDFAGFIKLVIEGDSEKPEFVPVHPLEPLTQEQVERQTIAEHEREMEALDLENYDPEDDTYAMGKECPNCGGENIHTNGPQGDIGPQHLCHECHHVWPVPPEVL